MHLPKILNESMSAQLRHLIKVVDDYEKSIHSVPLGYSVHESPELYVCIAILSIINIDPLSYAKASILNKDTQSLLEFTGYSDLPMMRYRDTMLALVRGKVRKAAKVRYGKGTDSANLCTERVPNRSFDDCEFHALYFGKLNNLADELEKAGY